MHYLLKSVVQNVVAFLPEGVGDRVYYFMQRQIGSLREPSPLPHFALATRLVTLARGAGVPISGTWLEVGTGRGLTIPLVLWMCGVECVISVDKNRLVREDLLLDLIAQWPKLLSQLEESIIPSDTAEFRRKGARLATCRNLNDILSLTGIKYWAPADATKLPLIDDSVDVHFSTNVLEHINPSVLAAVLAEASRVLKTNGRLLHLIDLSDHFSHSHRRLIAINFIRFNSRTWKLLAGNRFMYQNRLRAPEYLRMFYQARLAVRDSVTDIDETALAELRKGLLSVSKEFNGFSHEDLSVVGLSIVATKK